MKTVYMFIFLVMYFTATAQPGVKKVFYFFDADTEMPVQYVMAKDASGTDSTTYVSNIRGQIIIPKNIQKLHTSHINYRDTIVAAQNNKVLLIPSTTIMEEVLIQNQDKQKKGNLLLSVASPFTDFKINFSHNNKAALFIPPDRDNLNKPIKRLKYEVIDIFGVKNLKYLPFKAAIYTIDTITGLPDKEIYGSEIIKKKDNRKWVTVDVSNQDIKMPAEGLFIVFKVLEQEAYKVFTIESEEGIISAVPSVRAKLYSNNNPQKSYYCDQINKWEFIPCHFVMEIEF